MSDNFRDPNKRIIISFAFLAISFSLALWTFFTYGFKNSNAVLALQSKTELTPEQSLAQQPRPVPDNFVFVKGGTFLMGSSDRDANDTPTHEVTVSSFIMAKYPVTQKEWYEVMGTTVAQQRDMVNKSYPLCGEGDKYPMYYVNWYDALEYCNKLSLMEGLSPVYRISKD